MRIATYNLWNSADDWERRLDAIVDELRTLRADFVALQEVPVEASPGQAFAAYLKKETGYFLAQYAPYDMVPDPGERPEGLAILSRFAVSGVQTNWMDGISTDNSYAMRVQAGVSGASLGITNVHLDWKDENHRAKAVVDIVGRLVGPLPADVEILCGDFNEHDDGPVAAYLDGQREGRSRVMRTGHHWVDAVASACGMGMAPATLDFAAHPRWQGAERLGRPVRFDRVYLRAIDRPMPRVMKSGLFGCDRLNRFGIIPSDHYGVFVDLDL